MLETQRAKRKHRTRFTTLEDHHMITQYVAIGYQNYPDKKVFWELLFNKFVEVCDGNRNDRTLKIVRNRISKIKGEVDDFYRCVARAVIVNPRIDPINMMLIAKSLYSDIHHGAFERDVEWNMLKDVPIGSVDEIEDMEEDCNPPSSQIHQNFSNMFSSPPSSSQNPPSSQFVENQFTNNILTGIPIPSGYTPSTTPITISGTSSGGFTGDKRISKTGEKALVNKNLVGKCKSATPPSQDSQMSDAGSKLVDYLKESRTIVSARQLQQNQIMERLLETTQQQIQAAQMKEEREIMKLDLEKMTPKARKYFEIQQNIILAKQMQNEQDIPFNF